MAAVPDRYLFIRLSSLGDILVALPALAALRRARPGAVVDWVVDDRFAALLRQVRGVDRILAFPRTRLRPFARDGLIAHAVGLRRERYAAAIDFHGNLKSGLHLLAARAREKIGLDRAAAREGAHRFASVRVSVPRDCHRAQRALYLLEPLGIPSLDSFRGGAVAAELLPDFTEDPVAGAEAERALAALPAGPLAILHPGTSAFGAFKRLPAERYGEVARLLSDESGAAVLVTHGPGEEALAERAVRASSGAARLHPPRHGLAGLIAILRRAAVVVAADSGPLLLASALGRPTVALFGPKDPRVYAPPFGRTTVIRTGVPCSPCSLRRCADPICMTRMEAAPIAAAAHAWLSAAASSR